MPGPHAAIALLQEVFTGHADPAEAEAMRSYMKDVAPFYGIKAGPRRMLQKEVWQDSALPAPGADTAAFATLLFALPQRELHYAALDALQAGRRQWTGDELPLFEMLLRTKPWWDTVDTISTKLIAPYFQRFPNEMQATARRWNSDESMWVRRASIIFQIPYKATTDEHLLFDNIHACMHEKEFFIRKGIGWALREYAKTALESVRLFVEREPLSPLSRREAMKHSSA